MTEQEMLDEIDIAAGNGLAALSIVNSMLTKLALRGVFSRSDASQIFETAEELVGAGLLDASEGAVLVAQTAIRGLSQTWKKPDKPREPLSVALFYQNHLARRLPLCNLRFLADHRGR